MYQHSVSFLTPQVNIMTCIIGRKCLFGVKGTPRHGHARPRQRVFTKTQAAKKSKTAGEVLISAPVQVMTCSVLGCIIVAPNASLAPALDTSNRGL